MACTKTDSNVNRKVQKKKNTHTNRNRLDGHFNYWYYVSDSEKNHLISMSQKLILFTQRGQFLVLYSRLSRQGFRWLKSDYNWAGAIELLIKLGWSYQKEIVLFFISNANEPKITNRIIYSLFTGPKSIPIVFSCSNDCLVVVVVEHLRCSKMFHIDFQFRWTH